MVDNLFRNPWWLDKEIIYVSKTMFKCFKIICWKVMVNIIDLKFEESSLFHDIGMGVILAFL